MFVTVGKVRVHQSGSAADGEAGWSEVMLAPPQRVDMPSLNNGTPLPLGQTERPPPTGQPSGLKMNVNLAVPAGMVADFAIAFDACRSFVTAGSSGLYKLEASAPGFALKFADITLTSDVTTNFAFTP